MTAPDYLTKAQKRARRAGQHNATAPANGQAARKPYGANTGNRYATLTAPAVSKPTSAQKPAKTTGSSATTPVPVGDQPAKRRTNKKAIESKANVAVPLPVSLNEEFERVKAEQQRQQAKHRRFLHKPARPVRAAILSILAVVAITAAAILGPIVYRGTHAYNQIFQDQVPHAEAPFVAQVNPEGTNVIVTATATAGVLIPDWDGKERVTILLLGVDQREDEASRSDTMILLNIDPETKTASMMSIPRDLKVFVPGYGVQKVNAAYAYGDADDAPGGGPGLTIRTIEANFGITVNYYAEVNFQGFTKIVNTIGGLTIDVPYPIKDDTYPGPGNQYMRIYFQAGWQHMNGDQVLQYSRTRHDDGDGRRSARQQQVLLALRDQAVNMGLLSKAPELLVDFGDAIRTDLKPSQALQLARLGSEIDPADIVQYSLDDALTEDDSTGEYFLDADWEQVSAIMSQFTGVTVVSPMSALANSNYNITIQIQDGTINPGMGARIRDVLAANGFTNVTVTDLPDLGNYPNSSITTDTTNLTTAVLIANLLGIDLSEVDVSDSLEMTPTAQGAVESTSMSAKASPGVNSVALFPTPTGAAASGTATEPSGSLVIVIGDDAPDPAYYTDDPYTDDTAPIDGSGQ